MAYVTKIHKPEIRKAEHIQHGLMWVMRKCSTFWHNMNLHIVFSSASFSCEQEILWFIILWITSLEILFMLLSLTILKCQCDLMIKKQVREWEQLKCRPWMYAFIFFLKVLLTPNLYLLIIKLISTQWRELGNYRKPLRKKPNPSEIATLS